LGEVYFAAGDGEFSIVDFARKVVEVVGKGDVDQVPWPKDWAAMDVGDVSISNTRIKEAIPWVPRTPLEAGLALTRDYYRENLDAYLGAK
jgi:nucleoside-diphosphate-sugar epimerase